MLPFLKKEKIGLREQTTFIGKECKIYLPHYYFEDSFAQLIGEMVETIGIYWFEVDGKMYEQTFPLKMMFSFSEQTSKKNLKLDTRVPQEDYDIFILKTGDIFQYKNEFEENVKNIQFFINKLIEGAKMPKTVSYNEVLQIFLSALIGTGINTSLGVPSLSLEFLISELYRVRRNLTNEFRYAYNGKNEFDFKMVRITKVPELTSVFVSITGEDINTQFVNSIVRSRERKPEKESPLERVMRF